MNNLIILRRWVAANIVVIRGSYIIDLQCHPMTSHPLLFQTVPHNIC